MFVMGAAALVAIHHLELFPAAVLQMTPQKTI